MHSPLTILGLAVVAMNAPALSSAASGPEVSTTVYVGHFEVRDKDQPVKYVFNGDQRVAQITASLYANQRLQRWRLRSGWNSLSLAVTATNLIGQLEQFAIDSPAEVVEALYQWQPALRDYTEVKVGQAVEAGAVLWLRARTNVVVAVTGTCGERPALSLPPGGGYVPSPGLETWSPTFAVGATTWKYDSQSGAWRAGFTGDLEPASDAPPAVAPGEAIYVHTTEAIEFENPDPARRVLFYHTDHLGSASAITDAAGHLADETAFYPFGATRHQEHLGPIEAHYGFTQKERDRESGLQYFGHRYLHPVLGRWISTDPMLEQGGGPNHYAYVNQSPLKHYDPNGLEITISRHTHKGITTYEFKMQAVLINTSSTKFTQQELADYARKVEASIKKAYTGKEGNVRWNATANLRVINDPSEIGECDHVFRIMDKLRKGSDNGAGATVGGTKVIDISAAIIRKPRPDQVDHTNPANKHYTWENYVSPESTAAHETGHSAGLPHIHGEANLMQPGSERGKDTHAITRQQIEIMYKAASSGKLNQRDEELDKIAPRR